MSVVFAEVRFKEQLEK